MSENLPVRAHNLKVFENHTHCGYDLLNPHEEIEFFAELVKETTVSVGKPLLIPGDTLPGVRVFV